MIITGCVINHTNRGPAVTLSGIRGSDPTARVKFSNNIVLGGQIFCTDIEQITVQDNVVIVTDAFSANRIPIQVQRGGESVLVTGNLLASEDAVTGAVISVSEVNQRQVSRALIANNLCLARSRRGIQVLSSDDVAVEANMVVATDSCTQGIFVFVRIFERGHHLRSQQRDHHQEPRCLGHGDPVHRLSPGNRSRLSYRERHSRRNRRREVPGTRLPADAGDEQPRAGRVDAAPGARLFVKESDVAGQYRLVSQVEAGTVSVPAHRVGE